MSETVSPHNVDPVLADIKKPGTRHDTHAHRPVVHLEHDPHPAPPHLRWLRKAVFGSIVVIAVTVIGGGLLVAKNVQEVKARFGGEGEAIIENFLKSLEALGKLKPEEASQHLSDNTEAFTLLEQFLNDRNVFFFLDLVGGVFPPAREGKSLFDQITVLNQSFLDLSLRLAELKQDGFRYFQTDGSRFLSLVKQIRESIVGIRTQTRGLKNTTARLRNVSPLFASIDGTLGDHYVRRSAELAGLERFLIGIVDLLDRDSSQHIALFFQNPAELRPGGGFIGSYADLEIRNGQLTGIDVRNIYDPDGQLPVDVVPPVQLQTITESWGARDANWFFDFPTSARTVLGFLERSLIYAERNTTFQGAIALNINVFRSILEQVGPIPLPEYGLTIGPENFLNEIQREVEAGKDRSTGEPKRILKVLTPIVLERLSSLGADAQNELLSRLDQHLVKKNLMFYATDPALADFFAANTLDGGVYQLPNDFWGSYLAVVDANVAGGKSDAFVDQHIDARIDVDTAGGVLMDLSVTRAHRGDTQKDPWWRATNQNYLQIFTNPRATLVSLSGNDTKALTPLTAYHAGGYETNPDLLRYESDMLFSPSYRAWIGTAFGKSSVGTWFNVPAGKERTLSARYQLPSPDFLVNPSARFSFIFDRQSGVSTTLSLAILAPVGYVWSESSSPMYRVDIQDPDRRVRVDLTPVR